MSKDRVELLWASFGPGVRISGSSMEAPAVARDGARRVFRDIVHGDLSLVIEDPSMPSTVIVPWHNVGSCVYAEVALSSEKPASKAKNAEPQA